VKLSDYQDKVVVLFFMGHSCPSCKAVAPNVEKELNTDYAGKTDYAIFGLDTWDGNSNSMQSFKDVTGITFPLLLNASGVAKDYNTVYDRFVIIGKSGKIVHNGTSAATNDLATVKSKVNELLD
jgi:peroxiredoxin